MPRVRYTADGGRYRIAGVTFEPGDVEEVPSGLAEYLVGDVGSFEYVDGETVESADTDDGSDEADGSDTDGDLVDELREKTIPEIEDELEAGHFDDRLEAVANAEREGKDRAGVHDAIGVRRAEIEG